LFLFECRWTLDFKSPDWYQVDSYRHSLEPPFWVKFVMAGNSRLGWRWTNCLAGGACETTWLDPKPAFEKYDNNDDDDDNNNNNYDFYVCSLAGIQQGVDAYKALQDHQHDTNIYNEYPLSIPGTLAAAAAVAAPTMKRITMSTFS
jgi:hypothetical protein